MFRLGQQIREALALFQRCKTPPALIGGLALVVHGVIRATQDVDFLVDAADADILHSLLLALGYDCAHRSEDAANYRRGDEGLDFLYAHRPNALRLLVEARAHDTEFGRLRVISPEGLIGFKLQAYINNPNRTQDMEDIRALLSQRRIVLNMEEVRNYFRLFKKEALLDELIAGK